MNETMSKNLVIESRLTKNEAMVSCLQEDVKEVKRNVRMILGFVFSSNVTIIGLIIKALNMI
jgi:hypothetical protein